MWLLVDDKRDLNCECIARNSEAAKRLIALGGWECVCFDHDLGEKTDGYDILCWALENDFLPDMVQIVTSNPVGKERMSLALKNAGYGTNNNVNFYKG